MKISFPRHVVYVSMATVLLIIFAIWFATAKLIPMGKDFRKNKIILKKERVDLQRYQDFYDQTLQLYNDTKTKNRHIMQAFDTAFDPEDFKRKYEKYFIDLTLSKKKKTTQQEWYEVYEVNTTSKIRSPKNFYTFLDAINKSEWIINVTFPIHFKREGELLHSSFAMKVYKRSNQKQEEKKDSEALNEQAEQNH